MKGKWFHLVGVLMLAAVLAVWSAPAGAVTFDLSTLNKSGSGTSAFYYDPIIGTGTRIFNYQGHQQNPWTEGTGSGQAAIQFAYNTQGNNSSLVYVPSGGPAFSLPGTNGVPALSGTETSIGTGNTQYTGDYAQSNGFPLYFLFVTPGSTGLTPPPTPATLNSLYISGASTDLEIIGLNGLANAGGTPIPGYAHLVHANSGIQQVSLDWTGVTEVYILSATSGSFFGYGAASGFYVNDIEVNDPVSAVPIPPSALLLGSGLLGLVGLGWRRKQNQ
jgi:hypothetical protein